MSAECEAHAWQHQTGTPGERLVYLTLARHSEDDWTCALTAKQLTVLTGMSMRGIFGALKRLMVLGLVARTPAGMQILHTAAMQILHTPISQPANSAYANSAQPLRLGQVALVPLEPPSWLSRLSLPVWEKLTPADVTKLEELGKGLDMEAEARACEDWMVSHRRVIKGPFATLKNWLQKAQQSGRRQDPVRSSDEERTDQFMEAYEERIRSRGGTARERLLNQTGARHE